MQPVRASMRLRRGCLVARGSFLDNFQLDHPIRKLAITFFVYT